MQVRRTELIGEKCVVVKIRKFETARYSHDKNRMKKKTADRNIAAPTQSEKTTWNIAKKAETYGFNIFRSA